MKIRTGFVSNSSSSSFVIRGIKIKAQELAKILIEKDPTGWKEANKYNGGMSEEFALGDAIMTYKFSDKLVCEGMSDFFKENDEPYKEFVVGISITHLEDGAVSELPETNDEDIKNKIEQCLGICPEKLSTFIQYVSNDNY